MDSPGGKLEDRIGHLRRVELLHLPDGSTADISNMNFSNIQAFTTEDLKLSLKHVKGFVGQIILSLFSHLVCKL